MPGADGRPSREEAWQLLQEWTQNPNLLKHALAVEAAMRAYARRFGGDEELWGLAGLLHDMDYERYPQLEVHPLKAVEELKARHYPSEVVEAILGHNSYHGQARTTPMARALWACDELTGFIVAVALVRPSKDLDDVTVDSVKKKFKDKAFARGVNREEIFQGAEELGVPLDEHIQTVIDAMRGIKSELGLDGKPD
ncbi:MAG: HDIG domain-containing metalloprotein [Bacillota bacterium]